jgi:hypothetical protein
VLVVAEDVVRGPARQGRRPPADRHDLVLETRERGLALVALQLFTQGPDHDPGDRLTGARGKLAGQALGFGVADVQAMIEI